MLIQMQKEDEIFSASLSNFVNFECHLTYREWAFLPLAIEFKHSSEDLASIGSRSPILCILLVLIDVARF